MDRRRSLCVRYTPLDWMNKWLMLLCVHYSPRRGARSLDSADRPRHVDFSVKDWARDGVYV